MGLVDDDEVVLATGGQEPIGVAYQPLVPGYRSGRVPRRAGDRLGSPVAVVAAMSVNDWGVDAEFHQQFALPLFGRRLRRNDQGEAGFALVATGFEDDAGLQGLAQPHLIGNQTAHGFVENVLLAETLLVRPECSRYGGNRAVGVVSESVVDALPMIIGRVAFAALSDGSNLGRRRRRPFHDVVTVVSRQINDAQSTRLVCPQCLKIGLGRS